MAKKPRLISDQLRQAIDESGLTRYRISKETGISQVTLSRFYHGERGLTLKALDKLGACLQLTVHLGRKEKGK
ncbi:MAG: helix-turn-helix domain-containing protein [Pirellulaceae bacterium]